MKPSWFSATDDRPKFFSKSALLTFASFVSFALQCREKCERYVSIYSDKSVGRIHRAGEGAPYTGLKPAGRDLGPAIPAANKSLESGKVEALVKLLTEAMQQGVRDQFKQVTAKKKFVKDDVSAGREYVKGYVEFVHYVERIYEAAKNPAEGHYPESLGAAARKE